MYAWELSNCTSCPAKEFCDCCKDWIGDLRQKLLQMTDTGWCLFFFNLVTCFFLFFFFIGVVQRQTSLCSLCFDVCLTEAFNLPTATFLVWTYQLNKILTWTWVVTYKFSSLFLQRLDLMVLCSVEDRGIGKFVFSKCVSSTWPEQGSYTLCFSIIPCPSGNFRFRSCCLWHINEISIWNKESLISCYCCLFLQNDKINLCLCHNEADLYRIKVQVDSDP